MSATPQPIPPRARQITWRQKFGVLLFTVTVPILALNYWQHGGQVTGIGRVPIPILFLIACIGGAVSFVLYAEQQHRWFAAIPGAIAGLGGFGVHLFYTQWWQHDSIHSAESLLVAGVGASPGILFYWAIVRIGRRKLSDVTNADNQAREQG